LECYASKVGGTGVIKSVLLNAGYAGKAGALVKSKSPNFGNTVSYSYDGKISTSRKSIILPNTGNAVRYVYTGKTGAIFKSAISNASNIVPYGYTGEASAAGKSTPYTGNTVRNGYTGKAEATSKSPIPNNVNTVSYMLYW